MNYWQNQLTKPQSTGPKTEAGKEVSSKNAMKHGCCSFATLILPTENRSDFDSLEIAWYESYKPADEAEHHLINQLVIADWLRQRATRTYAEVEAQIFIAAPNPLDWTDDHHKSLTRFQRYVTTHTNNVAKHRKAVEDYRKRRTNEAYKAETLANSQTRLKTYQAKNAPPQSPEEAIRITRERAIRLGYLPPDTPPAQS